MRYASEDPPRSCGTPTNGAVCGTAVAALVLGLLGLTCLPGIGAVAAFGLGLSARGEIRRSEGRLRGLALANSSILLGLLGVGLVLALLSALITQPVDPHLPSTGAAKVLPPSSLSLSLSLSLSPPAVPHSAVAKEVARDTGMLRAAIGPVHLVDMGPQGSVASVLESEALAAARQGATLVVWLDRSGSSPSNGVALALRSAEAQARLPAIRLLRIQVAEHGEELRSLGFPIEVVPAFALLDMNQRPDDALHWGEWGEPEAKNIVAVLGKFVARTYTRRRNQWQSPRTDTDIPL